MGNFEEVSTGDGNLLLDGETAGFIRNVNFAVTSTELELYTGAPEQFQGAIPTRQTATLTCEALELSMLNLSRFFGNDVIVVAGSPVTVTDKEYTFAATGNYEGALQRILLDGPGVASLVIEPEGGGTPYVAGTDYLLDGSSRGVILLTGGDIEDDDTVQVSYTYTPVVSTEIRGGVTFTRNRFELEFIHPKITKGTNLVLSHTIVEPSANFSVKFASGDFIAPTAEFKFVRDNTSNAPLYRLREVAA